MISSSHRRRERRRRRSRRPHKLLKGIAGNLVRHPQYPWLAFDPRGVAAVEASRDLHKKSTTGSPGGFPGGSPRASGAPAHAD